MRLKIQRLEDKNVLVNWNSIFECWVQIVLSEDYACMHDNTHNNIHIQNKQNKTNQPTNATNILTLGDQVGT